MIKKLTAALIVCSGLIQALPDYRRHALISSLQAGEVYDAMELLTRDSRTDVRDAQRPVLERQMESILAMDERRRRDAIARLFTSIRVNNQPVNPVRIRPASSLMTQPILAPENPVTIMPPLPMMTPAERAAQEALYQRFEAQRAERYRAETGRDLPVAYRDAQMVIFGVNFFSQNAAGNPFPRRLFD